MVLHDLYSHTVPGRSRTSFPRLDMVTDPTTVVTGSFATLMNLELKNLNY